MTQNMTQELTQKLTQKVNWTLRTLWKFVTLDPICVLLILKLNIAGITLLVPSVSLVRKAFMGMLLEDQLMIVNLALVRWKITSKSIQGVTANFAGHVFL